MPAGGQRAVWVVLVKEIAVSFHDSRGKSEEFVAHRVPTYLIKCVGDECSISGPHVGVGVAAHVSDVVIIGGDDPTAIIDLGSHHKEAADEEIPDVFINLFEVRPSDVAEHFPVGLGSIDHSLRTGSSDAVVQAGDLAVGSSGGEPIDEIGLPVWGDGEIESNR